MLAGFCPSNSPDDWIYTLDKSNVYTVRSMRNYIDKNHLLHLGSMLHWNKLIPIKININSWRIKHDSLPTRSNLDKRGLDLHSIRCPLCDNDIETSNHIFLHCEVATKVWSIIQTWWGLNTSPIISSQSINQLADHFFPSRSKKKNVFDAVVQITLWTLWRLRNDSCFKKVNPKNRNIGDDIKVLSYTWINSRLKSGSIDWIAWSCNPTEACNNITL